MCRGIGAARGAVFSCLFAEISARGGEAQWIGAARGAVFSCFFAEISARGGEAKEIGAARGAVFSCLFVEISARRGGGSLYCVVGDAGAVAESAAGGEWGRAICIAGEARPFQENILIFCRQTVDKRRRKRYTIIEHLKKYSTIKRPVGHRSGIGRASVGHRSGIGRASVGHRSGIGRASVGRRSGVGWASVGRCAADFCGRMLE